MKNRKMKLEVTNTSRTLFKAKQLRGGAGIEFGVKATLFQVSSGWRRRAPPRRHSDVSKRKRNPFVGTKPQRKGGRA